MPLFSRSRRGRDFSNASLSVPSPVIEDEAQFNSHHEEPKREKRSDHEDPWDRVEVEAEEVQELLRVCTEEMKSRALDMPLLLLPYRPFFTDLNAARMFIRKFFQLPVAARVHHRGQTLYHDLKLVEPLVLCSIMKWCWSRLRGGVVTRNTYELFCSGEKKSNMAKNAFDTFIPLSVESEARKRIVFDFFDLLAAIAANSKTNGLGGRKLSRLAGWWAFSHEGSGKDFEECYQFWARSANATSHLFFAYLRSRAPKSKESSGISHLSRSLQALVAETEYPPGMPASLQSSTSKVTMLVDMLSNGPFTLLSRAKSLDYQGRSFDLQRLSYQDNLTKALTAECRRVLECISSNRQATAVEIDIVSGMKKDPSWTQFEDLGFSSLLDGTASMASDNDPKSGKGFGVQSRSTSNTVNQPKSKTPASWSEFMKSGFADDASERAPATLSLPSEQILPPFANSPASHLLLKDGQLGPGEFAGIEQMEIDETFWWVWMTSLATEEPTNRKALFGQCVIIETDIIGHRWLVFEERKQEILIPQQAEIEEEVEAPTIVEKKNKFSFGKRTRERQATGGKVQEIITTQPRDAETTQAHGKAASSPGHDQRERVQAAALALVQQKQDQEMASELRQCGRNDENAHARVASMATIAPAIVRDAGPALQWARRFDKEITRARYLGDAYAGRAQLRELSTNANALQIPSFRGISGLDTKGERELPPLPNTSTASMGVLEEMSKQANSPLAKKATPKRTVADRARTPDELEATPMTHRSEISTSLIPSPLMPRRKPVGGSVDLSSTNQDLTQKQLTSRTSEDLFVPKSRQDASECNVVDNADETAILPTDVAANLGKSKRGSGRGLRKLFGKRVASEPTKTLAAKRAVFELNSSTQPQLKVGRKRSFLRRNKGRTELTAGLSTAPPPRIIHDSPVGRRPSSEHSRTSSVIRAELDDFQGGEPGPVINDRSPTGFDISETDIRAMISHNMEPVSPTFSDFTQGPQEEDRSRGVQSIARNPTHSIPKYVEDYQHQPQYGSEVQNSRTQHLREPSLPLNFKTRAAALLFSAEESQEPETTAMHDQTPIEMKMESYPDLIHDESSSGNVTPEPKSVGQAGGRWAQIRQNAYQRRVSEDQAARGDSFTKTIKTDDGETSGEECEAIEARVARIKARVAELTGSQSLPGPSFQSRYVRA